jgi:ABC-2 type transport system permease protein
MTGPTIPRAVLQAAVRQARTTLIRKWTSPSGIGTLAVPLVLIAVLLFLRDVDFADGVVAAGGYVFAGFLGFGVVASAIMGVAGELHQEREDGTLLRAKAVPHGMTGHLLSKLFVTPVDALVPVVPAVVGAMVLLPEETLPSTVGGWLLLLVVFLLTVAAMMPWGAVLGAVFRSMVGLAWSMIAIYALAVVSGLFFPATLMPTWAQGLAQATPMYWIGRAFRAVLLPADAAAVEVGGEWRLGLTLAVLLAWTVVGLAVAPVLLRRMARRQSGSVVAAARERVMQRGY